MARITVHVTPRGGRNALDGWAAAEGGGGRILRVRVAAAAVDGGANEALLRVVAKAAGVAPSAVNIVTGARSRTKVLAIDGVGDSELEARIEAHIAAAARR